MNNKTTYKKRNNMPYLEMYFHSVMNFLVYKFKIYIQYQYLIINICNTKKQWQKLCMELLHLCIGAAVKFFVLFPLRDFWPEILKIQSLLNYCLSNYYLSASAFGLHIIWSGIRCFQYVHAEKEEK